MIVGSNGLLFGIAEANVGVDESITQEKNTDTDSAMHRSRKDCGFLLTVRQ